MDDTEDFSDYYECVLTPNNAPADSKTGVTFKGKDAEYLKAHEIIMNMAQSKGKIHPILNKKNLAKRRYEAPLSY